MYKIDKQFRRACWAVQFWQLFVLSVVVLAVVRRGLVNLENLVAIAVVLVSQVRLDL